MADTSSPDGVWGALRALYGTMSARRRRQFHVTTLLMLVSAFAELLTIGAVLPFLAIVSDAESAARVGPIRMIFDLLGWRPGDDLIGEATLLLIGVAIFAAAVRLALLWASQSFIFGLGHDLNGEIYRRILRQSYGYHVRHNTGETLAAIEKVQAAVFGVLIHLMQAMVSAIMAVFIIAILIAVDPATALIAAVLMGALYLAVSIVSQRHLSANSRIINAAHTERVRQLQEGLGGIRDILIDRSQPVFEQAFRRHDDLLRKAQLSNMFVSSAPRYLVEAIGVSLIALLALHMSGKPGGVIAAIPVLGALALGAQRLLPLLQAVYLGWSRAAGSLEVLSEVAELARMDLPPEPRLIAGKVRPFARDLVLDGVQFSYGEGRPLALRDIDLTIAKGERVGFVGRTGSGKSSLLDLIMGLLPPSRGEIRIDGEVLDEAARANWQAQIAHVPQNIYLADSDLAANIAFGQPADEIDMARVRAAAERAQIALFIDGLPDGYQTEIGERGIRLSGGQRQRIGIARALYKDAAILVLDEATSALDDETEAAVIEELSRGEGVTILVVAHRISTLKACDRLVRLEQGRIAAIGSYQDIAGASRSRS